MPKVSVAICKKCPRVKKCPDYKLFQQPLLFPDIKKGRLFAKKKKKRFQKPDTYQTPSREEQLALNFSGVK